MTTVADPVRWSRVFGRSTLSDAIFTVKKPHRDWVEATLQEAGLHPFAKKEWSRTFRTDGKTRTYLLPDGVAIRLQWSSRQGYYGELRNGMWVIGWSPLRLLCDLLRVTPPTRRLKGEPHGPSIESLQASLTKLVALPKEEQEEAAHRVRPSGLTKPSHLVLIADRVLGRRAVDAGVLGAVPSPSRVDREWEEAGFLRDDARAWQAAGANLAEARRFRFLGLAPNYRRYLTIGEMEALFAELGREVMKDVLELGMGRALPLARTGLRMPWLKTVLAYGWNTSRYLAYRDAGFSDEEIAELARAKVDLEEALAFRAIGVPVDAMTAAKRWGGTSKDVERLVGEGLGAEEAIEWLAERGRQANR